MKNGVAVGFSDRGCWRKRGGRFETDHGPRDEVWPPRFAYRGGTRDFVGPGSCVYFFAAAVVAVGVGRFVTFSTAAGLVTVNTNRSSATKRTISRVH